MTWSIPYETEFRPKERVEEITWGRGEGMNKKEYLPGHSKSFKIECRLKLNLYSRSEARERCQELHGTVFDGDFASGGYYVFYSGMASDYSPEESRKLHIEGVAPKGKRTADGRHFAAKDEGELSL